jgi:hypothetical protein
VCREAGPFRTRESEENWGSLHGIFSHIHISLDIARNAEIKFQFPPISVQFSRIFPRFSLMLLSRTGRAIAQAVSRRLPTAAAPVQTRVWSCGILWWAKVALGQVFSENFGFPCTIYIPFVSPQSSSLSPEAGRSGRSANRLTNQIKENNTEQDAFVLTEHALNNR